MNFAYLSFVNKNEPYISLTSILLKSITLFSKHNWILYLIDGCTEKNLPLDVQKSKRVVFREIIEPFPHIFCYKPFIALHAIENGLLNGYYIDIDSIMTPNCDKIYDICMSLDKLPISPIHQDDVIPKQHILELFNVREKTQHYVHAEFAFTKNCYPFIFQWLEMTKIIQESCHDETTLNCLYWLYDCKDHYFHIADPWYERFNDINIRKHAFTFHGCKDIKIAITLLNRMIEYYKK
jgi:hypothetical protein